MISLAVLAAGWVVVSKRSSPGDYAILKFPPLSRHSLADKGYHSRAVLRALNDSPWKTRIAAPKQTGFSRWHGDEAARRAVTNNRARLKSGVAREAFKLRAEIVERCFAHNLDRGGMRRTWLRGRENVHKRYLLHVAGHNLSLLMRQLIGAGTFPRESFLPNTGLPSAVAPWSWKLLFDISMPMMLIRSTDASFVDRTHPTCVPSWPREAVAGGYGGIFVLLTPTGAMLVAGGSCKAARRLPPPHSSPGGESRKKPLNQRAVIPLHPVPQYEGATQLSVGERVVGRESALCLGLSRVAPLRA